MARETSDRLLKGIQFDCSCVDSSVFDCSLSRGEGEWEGDWGNSSDKWTQKLRTLCDWPESTETDGVFFMAFEDFATQFQRVYVCRVFDNITELTPQGTPIKKESTALIPSSSAQSWCRVSLSGEWRGSTAAGHVCHLKKYPDRKTENNPQYKLQLVDSRPAVVFLTLTQPTQTGGRPYFFISLLVLKKNGCRAHEVKKSELVAGNTKCRNSREICAEVNLEPGVVYTVFVSTYNPNEESTFTLSAYCRYPVSLELLPETAPVK